jgi:hypothetical protein
LLGIMSGHLHIGSRNVWGEERPVILAQSDRRQHLYTVGKTGTGKTTLLRNMILQDIAAGEGVGVIDPHGDLAEDLLEHIPPHRSHHVVYLNPADIEYPPSFNLLANVPEADRPLIASSVVAAFKNLWSDSWGPRLEYLLYASCAALLECRNTSLLGIQRMLVDDGYRDWVLRQVKDPLVRSFWLEEFASYDRRFLSELVSPLQNKVGQLLMAPPLRNILGQVRNRIDPRFIMDRGRIFIANLSKGLIGADKSNLLGSVLLSRFELAAMGRVRVPETERRDFFMYVDEFHNFTTESFAPLLSECRKYHLNLILSHQHVGQLRPGIRDAVFGNVGSIVAFRVGDADAELLERELGRSYHSSSLRALDNFQVCVRLLKDNQQDDAFLARTLPASGKRYGKRDQIVRRSREQFTRDRSVVEKKIAKWIA